MGSNFIEFLIIAVALVVIVVAANFLDDSGEKKFKQMSKKKREQVLKKKCKKQGGVVVENGVDEKVARFLRWFGVAFVALLPVVVIGMARYERNLKNNCPDDQKDSSGVCKSYYQSNYYRSFGSSYSGGSSRGGK